MMKAGDAGRPYLNPTIFGKDILDLGINQSIELFVTEKDNIKFIVSNKPYFEFEYLQTLAKRANIKKAIKDARDEYFVCLTLPS